MSRAKTVEELDEQIKRLKARKTQQEAKERRKREKLLDHRKFQLGGCLYGQLKKSGGIDLLEMDTKTFDAAIEKYNAYISKYIFSLEKVFTVEQDADGNAAIDKDEVERFFSENNS